MTVHSLAHSKLQRQNMMNDVRLFSRVLVKLSDIVHHILSLQLTNEEVRRRMKCQRNFLQMVMNRKLNLFRHICRMNNWRLIKQVVFGMVDESRIRGRPNKECLDDIKEWTCTQQAQSRTEWRQFVKRVVDTNGHRWMYIYI